MLYKLTIAYSHVLKKEPKIGNIGKCTHVQKVGGKLQVRTSYVNQNFIQI